MIITKIEPYEDGKFYKLFADGRYVMSLAKEIVKSKRLCEGLSIDENELAELNKAVLTRRARERLLYSLDRRLHSEKELRDKLRRDYQPEIIDRAIAELDKLGLINDLEFARVFAEHRLKVQKKGKFVIRQELLAKGVDREITDSVIDELFSDNDEEYSAAMRVAEKYARELNEPNGKRKAYAALSRKGFSYDVVRRVLSELCDMSEDFLEE